MRIASVHFILVAILLGIAGSLKLISAAGMSAQPDALDPIFGVDHRLVFFVVGSGELLAMSYLVLGRISEVKHWAVLWLSVNFILYRIVHWWVSGKGQCPCLGAISMTPAGEVMDAVLKASLVYMFFGSCYFLAHHRLGAVFRKLSAPARWRLKWSFRTGLVLAMLPGLQVGCVAWVNPPTTGPILLRNLRGEGGPPAQYVWKDLAEIQPVVMKSLIVAEDNEFFQHGGFSWKHIRFALIESMAAGGRPRGASTITQQCARSLFLWQGRSWLRKGLEAYYTFWMELILTKQRILELYVNVIEMADGVYGIEAGANHHFGVTSDRLTKEQVALLAAVLPKPKVSSPSQPTDDLLFRADLILRQAEHTHLPLTP